jgi:hypothetical protein
VAFPIGTDIKFYKGMIQSLAFSKPSTVTVSNDQIALISVGEVFAIKKVDTNNWDFI